MASAFSDTRETLLRKRMSGVLTQDSDRTRSAIKLVKVELLCEPAFISLYMTFIQQTYSLAVNQFPTFGQSD